MLTHKDRIRALIGNIKNHDWVVNGKFFLEKEDADALQDIKALKEFIKERENPRGEVQ